MRPLAVESASQLLSNPSSLLADMQCAQMIGTGKIYQITFYLLPQMANIYFATTQRRLLLVGLLFNFLGPLRLRSFIVKENHIGLAISKILSTDTTHTSCYYNRRINYELNLVVVRFMKIKDVEKVCPLCRAELKV